MLRELTLLTPLPYPNAEQLQQLLPLRCRFVQQVLGDSSDAHILAVIPLKVQRLLHGKCGRCGKRRKCGKCGKCGKRGKRGQRGQYSECSKCCECSECSGRSGWVW